MLPRFRILFLAIVLSLMMLSGVAVYHFRNVPSVRVGPLVSNIATDERVRLFAVADTGSGNDAQLRVAAAMEQRCLENPVDGLLFAGDNFYMNGVASVDDPQWQSKMEIPYGSSCLRNATIYPALGNHDYKGNPGAQIKYSERNPRWYMPNRFYAIEFGFLLQLVVFDSNIADFCLQARFCAGDFLLARLDSARTVWKAVLAHHPLKTASTRGPVHAGGLLGLLLQPFVCGKTDLWIAGHAHHLEHRRLSGCGIDHFLVGGGGADLYDFRAEPQISFAKKSHGFLELEFSKDKMKASYISDQGAVLYSVERQSSDR